MAEIRQATILIRDRQVSGGALPSNALMAEPFVNLFDGVLRFSGVTGGGFEPSDVSSVFEVGSTLYNSKITNRLNINDNFIISGNTGQISTYNGTAALSGKFLSGTSTGFVLGNISDIQGIPDITRVQGGTNINTGGTANTPIINLDDNIVLTSINSTSISGVTFYSGSTDIDSIIRTIANEVDTGSDTFVQGGTNINTGGTANVPIINLDDNIVLTSVEAANLSATTLTDTRVVFAGPGGALIDDAGLTYASGTDVLTVNGNLTTNGTQYSGGTIVDDGIFTIDAVTQVEVDSDLLPTTHLAYDIGAVGQRWDRLFVRKIRLGTSSTILEDNLFSSTTGNFLFDFAGDLSIDNNVLPNANISYDLGSVGQRWKTAYAKDLDLSGVLSVTGITNSSLTAGRVVYVGAGGSLVDEAGFEYDAAANLLKAPTLEIGDPSTTGNTVATIYGNVLIMGDAVSGFTSQLYIEDNLIELNFNPTASTTSTSLGAGWSIQDGSGVSGTDVLWDIRGTATGLANRSFATNLQDIRIRETGTVSNPNGVRVIAEFDVIDGGSY